MDLITTGISASERMKRENLLTAVRNHVLEKMLLGGPSVQLTEVRPTHSQSFLSCYFLPTLVDFEFVSRTASGRHEETIVFGDSSKRCKNIKTAVYFLSLIGPYFFNYLVILRE